MPNPSLKLPALALSVAASLALSASAFAEQAQSITQYGITWKFDKPYTVGNFITGDYWVLGPVTIVSVSPTPGPAPAGEPVTAAKSIYGATALHDDKQMRNGSMIITGPDPAASAKGQTGFGGQGYDSRGLGYSPNLSVKFPLQLPVHRTLISSVSCETYGPDGKLASPWVLNGLSAPGGRVLLYSSPTWTGAMTDVAVLTCLDKAPPDDAFRPPYVGTDKPIYEAKNIHWELLPKLHAPASTPDWGKMERIYQRPWLDHLDSWAYQFCFPAANQPGYGREVARMNSIAGLMLLLDVPREKKEKLLIEYIQNGIDIHGVGAIGKNWISEKGGHFIGRKWPVLFASIMLGDESLRNFPVHDPGRPVFDSFHLSPPRPPRTASSPRTPAPTTARAATARRCLVRSHSTPFHSFHSRKPRAANSPRSNAGSTVTARWTRPHGAAKPSPHSS